MRNVVLTNIVSAKASKVSYHLEALKIMAQMKKTYLQQSLYFAGLPEQNQFINKC